MGKLVWVALFVAFLGVLSVVGFKVLESQRNNSFVEQIEIFQSQTAMWDNSRTYAPGDKLKAHWTFTPIKWDTDITMEATFLFQNTDTGQRFLSGEFRSLPFFNQLQYQVSKPLGFQPDAKRKVVTTYEIPAQVSDGNYKIIICQRFEHNGETTTYSCYKGPHFKVEATPNGS